jgi:hypothetical protein
MPIRTAIQICLIIRLGATARPEPLRIQATWRCGLLDLDSRAATETLDDPFEPFDQRPHISRNFVLTLRGAHGNRRDIARYLRETGRDRCLLLEQATQRLGLSRGARGEATELVAQSAQPTLDLV